MARVGICGREAAADDVPDGRRLKAAFGVFVAVLGGVGDDVSLARRLALHLRAG